MLRFSTLGNERPWSLAEERALALVDAAIMLAGAVLLVRQRTFAGAVLSPILAIAALAGPAWRRLRHVS